MTKQHDVALLMTPDNIHWVAYASKKDFYLLATQLIDDAHQGQVSTVVVGTDPDGIDLEKLHEQYQEAERRVFLAKELIGGVLARRKNP